MSRDRYKIYDNAYPHFCTCTIVGWTAIFTRPSTVEIVLDSWNYLRENRDFRVYAFVILENHLHLIASSPNLATDLGDFKSYTARRIIDMLKAKGQQTVLSMLRYHKKRHKTDREFQLWQEGSHPKQIESDAMMLQKIEYAHYNPVNRGYVDLPEHWRYSSARNYMHLPGIYIRSTPVGVNYSVARSAWDRTYGRSAASQRFPRRRDAERLGIVFPRRAWEQGEETRHAQRQLPRPARTSRCHHLADPQVLQGRDARRRVDLRR